MLLYSNRAAVTLIDAYVDPLTAAQGRRAAAADGSLRLPLMSVQQSTALGNHLSWQTPRGAGSEWQTSQRGNSVTYVFHFAFQVLFRC